MRRARRKGANLNFIDILYLQKWTKSSRDVKCGLSKEVMKRFFVFVGASCFGVALVFAPVSGFAQSCAARKSQQNNTAATSAPDALPLSTLPGDGSTLYEDAAKYVERKFDEFRQNRRCSG